MSTIKEVAQHANVARSTVSRVLNGGSVAESTRQRVMAAMESLNYHPNTIARSLATSRTGSIGMVVSDMEGPFFGGLMKRAEEVIRAQGNHLIVTSGHGNTQDELDAIAFLQDRRCDALLLHVDETPDNELIALAKKIPIILMNRFVPQLSQQCVCLDNQFGGYQATRCLLEQGHQRIGHISGPLVKQDARDRLQGYRQALQEQGITPEPELLVEGDFQEACGYQAMQTLLARVPELTAVFCANDYMAFGAIQALRDAGRRIPEQVSVIGFDDIVFARYLTPQLTTVRYPVEQLGEVAARMALDSIDSVVDLTPQQLEPALIWRGTVAAA